MNFKKVRLGGKFGNKKNHKIDKNKNGIKECMLIVMKSC
jgi:hypothetical protein